MVCETKITVNEELVERKINILQERGEQLVKPKNEPINVVPFEDRDYNKSFNKPRINVVELIGDKNSSEIHVQHEMDEITNQEIDNIIYA